MLDPPMVDPKTPLELEKPPKPLEGLNPVAKEPDDPYKLEDVKELEEDDRSVDTAAAAMGIGFTTTVGLLAPSRL